MTPTTEVLVAGNYCHDTLIHARGRFEVLGGSSSYISAVLDSVGARFQVVAKVGQDFLYSREVVRAPRVMGDGSPTTHFVDDFRSGVRQSLLKAECAPILPEDLEPYSAFLGLACGVARELKPETLVTLRSRCAVVIADLQGLIRSRAPDGRLVNLPFHETPFAGVLAAIDFLKVGEEELDYINEEELSRKTSLLVTRGRQGSSWIRNGHELRVEAIPADEIDSSGAGDCFTAGFAYGLLPFATKATLPDSAILEAMRWGNHFGALAVAQVGIPDFSKLARQG